MVELDGSELEFNRDVEEYDSLLLMLLQIALHFPNSLQP